jgi:Flp pilus assembly pilin Flp
MEYLTRLYVRLSEHRGQATAEYALIVGLVATVTVAAWTLLGTQISAGINSFAGQI